ncbi:MAG: hypothetical protein M3036_05895, partial [Bifidobacteriales bacterium]|nr:hypothetical protein [Bifidobacteriales bacterium]
KQPMWGASLIATSTIVSKPGWPTPLQQTTANLRVSLPVPHLIKIPIRRMAPMAAYFLIKTLHIIIAMLSHKLSHIGIA